MPTMSTSPIRRALTKRASARLTLLKKQAFDKLTKHQKRVAIARDVLFRLKTKRLIANYGSLIQTANIGVNHLTPAAAVQKVLNEAEAACPVCAKGALLASWVGNFDSVTGRRLSDASYENLHGFPAELINTFGQRLASALETAFEERLFRWNEDDITLHEASALCHAFNGGGDTCLEAIYRNLVKNRGKLVIKANGAKIVFD